VSTVVAKAHDRQRCIAFGDVERLSERDTSLVDDDFETSG
jgi:hypothetical protein